MAEEKKVGSAEESIICPSCEKKVIPTAGESAAGEMTCSSCKTKIKLIATGGEEAEEEIVCAVDDQGAMEERALSVFADERHEDLTALIFCLVTTFLVLLFTKWLA